MQITLKCYIMVQDDVNNDIAFDRPLMAKV